MFNLFKKVLGKTNHAIKDVAPHKRKLIPKDEFEDILLEADVHYELVERLLDALPDNVTRDPSLQFAHLGLSIQG